MRPSRIGLAFLILVVAHPIHAATRHVPGDYPTIQAGIDAAAPGDTVRVACGTYLEPTLAFAKGNVVLASETGAPDCVTIDAQRLGRVMVAHDIPVESRIEGITFRNGNAVGPPNATSGGGIHCTNVVLRFTACDFVGNYGLGVGAGLYGWDSDISMIDCAFRDNSKGGIFCGAGSVLSLERCVLEGSDGWALRTSQTTTATVVDCIFRNNVGAGAIRGHQSSTLSLSGCVFADNECAYGEGGGFSVDGSASATLTECRFTGNAANNGSAVAALQSSSATLTRCEITGSSHYPWNYGDVLFLWALEGSTGPTLTLDRCTIVDNDCAIIAYAYDAVSSFAASRSVIAFNSAYVVSCPWWGSPDYRFTCCDLFGNGAGDFVNCITDQAHLDGNFSLNPLFCDLGSGDFTLDAHSPCLPGNHPDGVDCGTIGALGVGCGTVAVRGGSWGTIKALYR